MKDKILNFSEIKKLSKKIKSKKKKILLAHGVFDVIHIGHLKYFEKIKDSDDCCLFVSITDDKFVEKGPSRPMFKSSLRAEMLASLKIVDYVVIVEHKTAVPIINHLKPNFYCKGYEYKNQLNDQNLLQETKAVKKNNGNIKYINTKKFSSSEIINEKFNLISDSSKKFIKNLNKIYNQKKMINFIENFKDLKVMIIGETIVDEYVYVTPLGKSAKENLISNLQNYKNAFLGGSVAVAENIYAFAKNSSLFSIAGKDKQTLDLFRRKNNQLYKNVMFEKNLNTIWKRRYIEDSYTKKKIFSIYNIKNNIVDKNTELKFFNLIKKNIKKYDMVVVNDFGHGLITEKILSLIVSKSKFLAINVQTNSANIPFNPVTKYKKADFVCIDVPEAKIGIKKNTNKKIELFKELKRASKFKNIIITEGKYGCWYVNKNKVYNIPIFNEKIVDTMGSGDAFFSLASISLFKSKNILLAGFLGNIAGALKVLVEGHSKYLDSTELKKFVKTLIKI